MPISRYGTRLWADDESRMYLLVAFINETQKTPNDEVDKARRRMKELGL
jgi:phage-related protein